MVAQSRIGSNRTQHMLAGGGAEPVADSIAPVRRGPLRNRKQSESSWCCRLFRVQIPERAAQTRQSGQNYRSR